MSRFFWVRHGPTHARGMVGWSDIPADLSNHAQIARLRGFLPDAALVISSDLIRAAHTADAIAGPRLRLAHDADLREIHFGDWELKHHTEIEDQAHARRYWEQPGDIRPPGGESWNDVVARVHGAVDRVLQAHPGRDIVAVAHFGVILTQVQRALNLTAYQTFAHKIDNLSVTELHLRDGVWQSERVNHLP